MKAEPHVLSSPESFLAGEVGKVGMKSMVGKLGLENYLCNHTPPIECIVI